MPRKNIPLVTGEKYHVYNRGVDKRDIFLSQNDYVRFYRSLRLFNSVEPTLSLRQSERRSSHQAKPLVTIEAYCLLPNHYHLLLKQDVDGGISEFMKRISAGYTNYFNEKRNRTGVLFQGGFKRSSIVNDEKYRYLFAYINENHAVHGLTPLKEVFSTSSWHYQNVFHSNVLSVAALESYDRSENLKLAREIYQQRQMIKNESGLLE